MPRLQGPRGTTLSGEQQRRGRTLPVAFLAAGVVALDQATKVLAVRRLADGGVALPGGVLDLVLVRNSGAAFSLGTSATMLLSLVAIAVLGLIARTAARTQSAGWAVVLGLVAGGAGGNLVDRLLRDPGPLRGEVVDFLRLPYWPVFNVADIAITAGAALGVLLSLRGVGLDGHDTAHVEDAAGS